MERMGDILMLSVIQPITIDTILNNTYRSLLNNGLKTLHVNKASLQVNMLTTSIYNNDFQWIKNKVAFNNSGERLNHFYPVYRLLKLCSVNCDLPIYCNFLLQGRFDLLRDNVKNAEGHYLAMQQELQSHAML